MVPEPEEPPKRAPEPRRAPPAAPGALPPFSPAFEVSVQLARASASARARVAALRARGATVPELDGRLAAADLLSKRGEPEAALKNFEEVLVLANALVQQYGLE